MSAFLMENLSTIIIGLVLAVIVALIVTKMVKDRKKGKSSCGCGCENCPSSSMCHK
ncbi:MAG: FeoB-associated Cys-rich membrane protein [Lachnospiraceae bacterium]|nr:FeoB-associated Cys-rich membrane protein [Lachnospiraceae bacterium]